MADSESIVEAAKSGRASEVQWFLSCGEDVNVADQSGMTALHHAVQQGYRDCMDLLLRAGADLNAQNKEHKYTPLHIAILKNRVDVVKLLVGRGASLEMQDKNGRTGLVISQGVLGPTSEVTQYLAAVEEKQKLGKVSAIGNPLNHSLTSKAPETSTSLATPVQTSSSSSSASSSSSSTAGRQTSSPPPPSTESGSHSPSTSAVPKSQPSTPTLAPTSSVNTSCEKKPSASTPPKSTATSSRTQVAVIFYKGNAVAVIKFEEDDYLADVRVRLEEEEVLIPFPFLFCFQHSGAIITRRQEDKYLVSETVGRNSDTPALEIARNDRAARNALFGLAE
jgi:hypothetical protein